MSNFEGDSRNSENTTRHITSEDTLNANIPTFDTLEDTRNDFSNILEKPYFIKTIAWASTVAPGINLPFSNINIPEDIMTNKMVKAPFETSRFWKGTVCLNFQAIGTPLHQGLLMAYFKPNNATFNIANSISDALASPHVCIYANKSTSTCLEIPFCVPTTFASTLYARNTGNYYNSDVSKFINSLGTVTLMVVSPLDSSSTKTISVTVTASFKNIMFKTPANFSIAIPAPLQKEESGVQMVRQSAILATIATAALPNVVKFIKDGIDRAGKRFFKWVGLDNPTDPRIHERMKSAQFGSYNNTTGVEMLDRLTMNTENLSIAPPDLFPSTYDEMSMDYILSKLSYLKSFYVRNTDAVGSVRCTIPIGPFCSQLVTGDNNEVPIITKMAMLSRYWRGTMRYTFKVSGTDMHTCKLTFVKVYGLGDYAQPPAFTDLVNFDTEIIEVNSGGQEIVIDCPFNSPLVMATTDMYYQSSYRQNGILFVYISSPLQYPSSAQPYITISTYVSAGPDFSFYGPCEFPSWVPTNNLKSVLFRRDIGEFLDDQEYAIRLKEKLELAPSQVNVSSVSNMDIVGYAPLSTSETEAQTKAIDSLKMDRQSLVNNNIPTAMGTEEECLEDPHKIQPKIGKMAPIKHLRDITRRYVYVAAIPMAAVVTLRLNNIFRAWINNSPIGLLSNFYDAFYGGLRFKIVYNQGSTTFKTQVFYKHPVMNSAFQLPIADPPSTTVTTNANWATTYTTISSTPPSYTPLYVTQNNIDCTVEFEVPLETPFRFTKIHQALENTPETDFAADLGNVIFTMPAAGVAGTVVRIYVSLADEARFGIFNHNGPVTMLPAAAGNSTNLERPFPPSQVRYFSNSDV